MSSICGIVDFWSEYSRFDDLRTMANALSYREGGERGAYVNRGVSLYCHGEDSSLPFRAPVTLAFGERSYTLLFDGEVRCDEHILSRYDEVGIDSIRSLGGAFSLAILDESRRTLILARGGKPASPLYYSVIGEKLIFASEIKGILAYTGKYPHCDISELSPDEIVVFSDGRIQ